VDKFIGASKSSGGGVGGYMRMLDPILRDQGHEVLYFGCGGDSGPEYEDFSSSRSPLALLRMIHNSRAAASLADFLNTNPVDLIHLHNIYHQLTPSIIPVAREQGANVVMTVHDYRQAGLERYFWGSHDAKASQDRYDLAASRRCSGLSGLALGLEAVFQRFTRRYFRGVGRFFCPSMHMCRTLRLIGAPVDKIVYMPNPVRFPAISRFESGGPLVFAGRLSVEKSPGMMLELATALADSQVIIAGDGPEGAHLRALTDERDLKNVSFTGYLDKGAMDELYSGAAAVVLTSRCMENSPATMLEAMAAQRCVIVPDQPALREWVKDGVTGRLFETGDVDSLINVAQQVVANPQAAAEMGKKARELIMSRHGIEELTEKVIKYYTIAAQRRKT
jgi:glycosyltransferase involved in cell wall biosynthesis